MHILLLGAGFSRNWNGWLASELNGELMSRLARTPLVARQLRISGNFEETLGNLQQVVDQGGNREGLDALQLAIAGAFADMNRSFAQMASIDGFSNDLTRSVKTFLSKFDAIFTLNQDLLLELHYTGFPLSNYFPGVRKPHNWDHLPVEEKISQVWATDEYLPVLEANTQPIFKMHGSVNWRDHKDRQLLVMGTGKEAGIAIVIAQELGAGRLLRGRPIGLRCCLSGSESVECAFRELGGAVSA